MTGSWIIFLPRSINLTGNKPPGNVGDMNAKQLANAILIATKAHDGQYDLGGMPYILHPLRVMMNVRTIDEKTVAVLHDVVEDTKIQLEDLRLSGFDAAIVGAVGILTKSGHEEGYFTYIQRVGTNAMARAVKIADLEDNMDVRRLPGVTEKDFERLVKYRKAWEYLKL